MKNLIATMMLAVPLTFAAQTAPATTTVHVPATTAATTQKIAKVKKVKVQKTRKAHKTAKHVVAKSNVKKG